MATTNEIILKILNNAAGAHGVYEAEVLGGVHHVEWADWYAEHMTRELEQLGYALMKSAS